MESRTSLSKPIHYLPPGSSVGLILLKYNVVRNILHKISFFGTDDSYLEYGNAEYFKQ